MGEPIQDGDPHMQLHRLALKGASHDPFAQALEAMHLGFHQAAPMVAAPHLPNLTPKPFAGQHRLVAHQTTYAALLAQRRILARRNHRVGPRWAIASWQPCVS